MVKESNVLGNWISLKMVEVDRAKEDMTEKNTTSSLF